MDLALLLIRLVFGLTFAAHGTQKLLGWFGGHGLEGTAGFFESLGLKPGKTMALMAGLGEVVGGLLIAFGFLTEVGAVLMIVPMLVAIFKVHGQNGYWATEGGYEYNLAIITVAVALVLAGPGAYSIDALMLG
ncbi:DoxX family protein [Bacillus sp. Marseille-Q3570]|uniref:DoxX family protein n=1 Tax=Bacillus sp. Marseille-Q3570 TaxID=2963522 RepID=UPI0021B76544|nr:DoxX family protein [Bacillus sp. Marseille-Q3570]